MKEEIIICANSACRQTFVKKRENQKHCSRECYLIRHKPKRPREEKNCPECGNHFSGTKKDKYCSDECRKIIKKRNNKTYLEKEGIKMRCMICGRRFIGREKTPICSTHCRSEHRKQQKENQ